MRSITSIAATLALIALAGTAQAQLAEQKTLSYADAQQIIAAATAEAAREGAGGGVAVGVAGGNLIAVGRVDGTFPAGAQISIGKARTAALFKKPTKFFEDVINKGRTAMATLTDFTPLQGGVPIVVDDQVVGAVGVSGAKSAQNDEEIAMIGAAALDAAGAMASGANPAEVVYYDAATVAAAFEAGRPLIEVPGYKVHASRREMAGMVEVHLWETDVIYVVAGTATLVTGGKVLDGKATEAGQVRGTQQEGGVEHHLAKGDVIIVPNGVPHRFTEVSDPFTYFTVKPIETHGGQS
jgi:glc operon protein GlcG